MEDGLNGLHNKSLALSLLEICHPSSSSSPLNVLQVLQRCFKFFKDSWDRISPELGPLENLVFKMRGDVSIYSDFRGQAPLWIDMLESM